MKYASNFERGYLKWILPKISNSKIFLDHKYQHFGGLTGLKGLFSGLRPIKN